MPALLPELVGRRLTVDAALKKPTVIRDRIAKLADEQILLPKLFHALGDRVQAGGMLYSVIKASDFFTSSLEKRAPGGEYKTVEGVDPETKLAVVEDWGGKFSVSDERRDRNDVSYIDQQTTQIANTITRRLDVAAVQAVEDAIDAANAANVVDGHVWHNLVTVGPLDQITPSASRPTADLSAAQMAADVQEMGITHDLLIVNPEQAHDLRVAYGEGLDAMLSSAGVDMFSNQRVPLGSAYACKSGEVGTVGFERPLNVDVWDDRSIRSTWVQAYAVPAFAVDKPYAMKKIRGLR